MCNYGDVRLVGGSHQYEGRVEVCIANQWGTVCSNSWNSYDATVVCKDLGYAFTNGLDDCCIHINFAINYFVQLLHQEQMHTLVLVLVPSIWKM